MRAGCNGPLARGCGVAEKIAEQALTRPTGRCQAQRAANRRAPPGGRSAPTDSV